MSDCSVVSPGVSVVHQSSDDRHWPQLQTPNWRQTLDTAATTIRKATTLYSKLSITAISPDHIASINQSNNNMPLFGPPTHLQDFVSMNHPH